MNVLKRERRPADDFKTGRHVVLGGAELLTGPSKVVTVAGHVALVLLKGVIPHAECDRMYPNICKIAGKSRARAAAAGPLRASTRARVRAHPHLKQVSSYAYVQNRPGYGPGGVRYTSSVESGTAGWVSDDKLTRWTYDNFNGKYQTALDLAGMVDKAFAKALPQRHRMQARDLAGRPKMSAAFSTMAANNRFRTATTRLYQVQCWSLHYWVMTRPKEAT